MSGNFSGATLNIKSTLKNVTQTLNARPADSGLKAELERLIGHLGAELEKTPPEKEETAVAVAQTAQALLEYRLQESFLEVIGEPKLLKAAWYLAEQERFQLGVVAGESQSRAMGQTLWGTFRRAERVEKEQTVQEKLL